MKQFLTISLVFIACCLSYFSGYTQSVSTLLSKDKWLIGEQVQLQLKVSGVDPSSIQQDFVFPDSINRIEILKDTMERTDATTLLYTLTLTSFDSGNWQIPPFEMLLNNRQRIASVPIEISVLPVDVSTMMDYHDIKDIQEVPAANNWYVIAAIVASGIISLFAFLWFINRKAIQKITPASIAVPSAYQQLMKELSDYEQRDLSNNQVLLEFCRNIPALTRKLVDVSLSKKTQYLTTGEYITIMKGSLPSADQETVYFQLLRLTDAVKFARFDPPIADRSQMLAQFRQFVQTFHPTNTTQR